MSLDLQLPANRLRRNDAFINADGGIYRVVNVHKKYRYNPGAPDAIYLSVDSIANAVDGIIEIDFEYDDMVDIWKLSDKK